MAGKGETKGRILDAAELLFAEHGFKETSLRTITSKAGVNLASVNYHYGDKKTLVRAVLSRYLEEFMPALKAELEVLLTRDDFSMEDVFRCVKAPLIGLNEYRHKGRHYIYVSDWAGGLYRCPGTPSLVYSYSL